MDSNLQNLFLFPFWIDRNVGKFPSLWFSISRSAVVGWLKIASESCDANQRLAPFASRERYLHSVMELQLSPSSEMIAHYELLYSHFVEYSKNQTERISRLVTAVIERWLNMEKLSARKECEFERMTTFYEHFNDQLFLCFWTICVEFFRDPSRASVCQRH